MSNDKNIFYTIFFLLVMTVMSHAATRGDVKVIEASENIRYLSQNLAKEYFFFYAHPKKIEVKDELNQMLLKLNDNFRVIARTTTNSDTKDILEFLAYSKDQIAEIFNEKPDQEKAALMLDYSETLLEGADSIASAHAYDFSDEERMLMTTKKMEYLLERITKYYMAINTGFDNITNKESMQESIDKFDENMEIINAYQYPDAQAKEQENINHAWSSNKLFFSKSKDLFIPALMFCSIGYLEKVLDDIALYHSKNQ
ncbi:Nitric oxide-responding transcriptional regulator Dnr (Crp/Fnr family) [hydrothermal vent metagenome]|uniref:Nitric oxide-responding transcriptional regulator Dnr (Crp/Fnr family) n=1 Tax=hydrothermal vent metagenome TaxID=652676 RepID=A0A1W1CTB5_9ZZZZ